VSTVPTTTVPPGAPDTPIIAFVHRVITKYNLSAHSIFIAWIFLETQWYSNAAFKQLIMDLYAHTGLWFHAIVPVVLGMIVNYRNSLAKPQEGQ
jgi:hypothetical protein